MPMHKYFQGTYVNVIVATKAVHQELSGIMIMSRRGYQYGWKCNEQKYVGGEEFVAFSPPNIPGMSPKLLNLTGPLSGMTVPTST